jgi:hypothetical protein
MGNVNGGRKSPRERLLTGVALCATLIGIVGCGTEAKAGDNPPPSSSTTPSTTSPAGPSTAPAGDGATDATASDAATYWITQVLESHYQRACLASAPAVAPGQDPKKACPSNTFTSMAQSLHKAWAKPGVTLPPKGKVHVTATTLPSSEGTVVVPDTTVTLDGRTLRALELIGASGDIGSVSLSLDVREVDNTWHVSNWNINL